MKTKLKTPGVGFYLTCVAVVLTVAAFILSVQVAKIFTFTGNVDFRWIVFLSVGAIWLMAFFLVNGLFAGDKPFWVAPLYAVVSLLITFAIILVLLHSVTYFGIYFTVGNMGDVEAMEAGVPRAIAGIACYLVALILIVAAAFCKTVWKDKEGA